MNTCDCKHVSYCKVDSAQCRLVDDPWCKPDGTIFGYTTRAINQKQGRDFDLIEQSKPKATKPKATAAGLAIPTPWLTLYHNGSTQPVGQSFQADPRCLGEPDQVAGGLRIWNVDDDLRIVASVTPLQLTEPPALRYADDDDNLTEDEPE